MFVKKMFGSFAIILAVMTIPFMFYRFMNDKEPHFPTSVIVDYISTYDEWDSLVSSLNEIVTRTGFLDEAIQYYDEFAENSFIENIFGLGELVVAFSYPAIGTYKILVAVIEFIVGNIEFVFGLFEVVRQY